MLLSPRAAHEMELFLQAAPANSRRQASKAEDEAMMHLVDALDTYLGGNCLPSWTRRLNLVVALL